MDFEDELLVKMQMKTCLKNKTTKIYNTVNIFYVPNSFMYLNKLFEKNVFIKLLFVLYDQFFERFRYHEKLV